MRSLVLFLALVNSLPAFPQSSWTLSNSGLPSSTVRFTDFAIAPNGYIYLCGTHQTWSSYAADLYRSNNCLLYTSDAADE